MIFSQIVQQTEIIRKRAPKGSIKGIHPCPTCGTLYENATGKKKFCSKECRPKVDKTCLCCGKSFKAGKKSDKFCSSECQKQQVLKDRSEKLNGSEALTCLECGLVIGRSLVHHVRNKHGMSIAEYKAKHNVGAEGVFAESTRKKLKENIEGENNPWANHDGKFSPFSEKFVNYVDLDENAKAEKINETIRKANDGVVKANSLQYFLNQGHDEFTARSLLKQRQSTFSLQKCIDKYGEEDGKAKWQARQDKWQKTLLSKPLHEQEIINQNKVWKSGSMSKIAEELFEKINLPGARYGKRSENNLGEKMEIILADGKEKRIMIDFLFGNKVIEFFGDYWHANPKKYVEEDTIFKRRTGFISAKAVWQQDANRESQLRKLGYEVKIVWENDFRKDKEGVIKECLEFLNRN